MLLETWKYRAYNHITTLSQIYRESLQLSPVGRLEPSVYQSNTAI